MFATLAALPNLHAQRYIIGSVVAIEEAVDGMEVVFEGRSDNSNQGAYLGPLTHRDNIPQGESLKLTRFEGSTVPEEIVWILCEVDSLNPVTGDRMFNLLNKATGEYIGTGDWNDGDNNGRNRIFMVADRDEAAPFCFRSATAGDNYSGVVSGSFDNGDWPNDPSTITICEIDESIPNGRGFIANESNEGITAFWEWPDTNIWSMRRYTQLTSGRDYLMEFLNNMPYNWQDTYKVGTDPGYVQDAEKFQRFYDLWIEANDNMGNMSDDDCMATFNELSELYEWLQSSASMVPFEDGGYYYFFTANTAFTGAGNGNYAIYAPKQDEPKILGWKAFDENDPRFIWQVKPAGVDKDGTVQYSVQNMGSGLYINRATSKADSQPVEWSSEYTTPTVFINLDHAGQWNISDQVDNAYPPRPFHQENHANGLGTAGKIVLWSGGLNSASSWFIKKVPQDKVDMLASMESRISLANYLAQNGGLANGIDTAMNKPGYISSMDILNNYRQAEADADTMLNHPQKEYTAEEYTAMYNALKSAAEAFKADRDRGLADGYYRIRLLQYYYQYNDSAMFLNIVDGNPGWSRADKGLSPNHVWKLERTGGNRYNVQNMGNGKFLYKGETAANGTIIKFSSSADVAQIIRPFDAMNGQFYLTNETDSTYYYDSGDHNSGTGSQSVLKYWNGIGVNAGTAWAFEPVTEEEYAAIEAAGAQTNLNYELGNVIATAKRLYNQNTTYTYGDKQIIDASQIYSNNSSIAEGKDFSVLIDGTNTAHWNSAWDTETNPGETHYLRLQTVDPEGLPDSVILYYEERNDATWHRAPSKLRVSASNDANEWTYLYVLEKPDITTRDLTNHIADPFYVLVNGIKGYQYVRFEFLAVQPDYCFNNHPVAEFSELNIMPVTGVDPSSLTQSASYKVVSDALYDAIQAGQKEILAGTATQATIDLISKAIIDFNNVNVADSIVSMAKLNIQNLTDGEMIGEFPATALDTYNSEAQAAIDEYEAASEKNSTVYTTVINALKAAYDKLYPQMVKPEEGKWYVLQLADESTQERMDNVMVAGGGYAHTDSRGNYSYWLTDQTIDMVAEDELAHFLFKANEDGTYTIQNAGTGFYNGPETGSGNGTYDYRPIQWYEPDSINIIPFGSGQIGLRLQSGRYFYQNPAWLSWGMEYQTHDGTQGLGSKYAWIPLLTTSLTDAVQQTDSAAQGRVITITKPYELTGLPMLDNGNVLQGYKVVGKLTAEESADSIVTAYQLQALEDDRIPAGQPVVYIVDADGTGKYNAGKQCYFTFHAVIDGEVTNEPDTVNGLAGTLDQIFTPVDHYGYFTEDSVYDEPAGATIGFQRGVLIPWLVEQVPDAQVDKVIYVKGNGMLNDIKDIIVEDQKEKVDVYSIDGVLIRRNVARAGATNGLAKGIYIVGKQKVLVK